MVISGVTGGNTESSCISGDMEGDTGTSSCTRPLESRGEEEKGGEDKRMVYLDRENAVIGVLIN